jgi:hypothetical protein
MALTNFSGSRASVEERLHVVFELGDIGLLAPEDYNRIAIFELIAALQIEVVSDARCRAWEQGERRQSFLSVLAGERAADALRREDGEPRVSGGQLLAPSDNTRQVPLVQ